MQRGGGARGNRSPAEASSESKHYTGQSWTGIPQQPTQRRAYYCYNCGRDGHMLKACNRHCFSATTYKRTEKTVCRGAPYGISQRAFRPDGKLECTWSDRHAQVSDKSRMYGETCSQEVISKLVGSRCEASVDIEGDRVSCLLDSGSQGSTMSISYFNRHLSDTFSLHQIGKLVTIEAANGLPIPYLGFVQVNIELAPDLTACQASTSVLMFVCPDTSYINGVPVILGTNVLNEICSQTDAEQRSLPALHNVLNTFRAAEASRDGHIGKVRVCTRRAIVIRP